MYEDIAQQISAASTTNDRSAMFHFQVLLHAERLKNVDPKVFVTEIGMQPTWATEFSKMMKLSKIMRQQGFVIAVVN